MTGLRRHTLVWLSRAPGAEDAQDSALVDRWHADGWPFVVCRRRGEPGELSLGFCVVHDKFPEVRPRRIAAHTVAKHVVRIARPPALEEVAKCRPAAAHAAAFARLGTEAARAGLDLRIYGSWMWQALTGQPHVRPSSDLDILVEVGGRREAEVAGEFLERQEPGLPFKLDGELAFADGGEVQWREYRQNTPEVLLKAVDRMHMIRREALRS
ncbi:MAG: malonate decarboxylase holo-[acyl-carrier-protein] synthase [Reyranella sp.]|nr:malonate decarboxylase holo-[acyl-carrier-protein] synthase [Reyranella sp.]